MQPLRYMRIWWGENTSPRQKAPPWAPRPPARLARGRRRHRPQIDRRRIARAEVERVHPQRARLRGQRGRLVRKIAGRDREPQRMTRLDHGGGREDLDLE